MTIINSFSSIKNFIPNRTLQLGCTFGNTGYLGIPISIALLPNHDLIYSIGFDIGTTLIIRGIGPILLTNTSKVFSSHELKALSKQYLLALL